MRNFWNFLFDGYGVVPNLHSFPTRRSSDLGDGALRGAGGRPGARRARGGSRRRDGEGARGAEPEVGRRRTRRSEEHTSELQSQSNLVCRLLLEKKSSNDSSPEPMPPSQANI